MKVIGATAHYATSELDAGPIIEQVRAAPLLRLSRWVVMRLPPGTHVAGKHLTTMMPAVQDVTRISHRCAMSRGYQHALMQADSPMWPASEVCLLSGGRDSVRDMIRKGRDLERLVLARALRSVLSDRVMVNGNRTVVFED